MSTNNTPLIPIIKKPLANKSFYIAKIDSAQPISLTSAKISFFRQQNLAATPLKAKNTQNLDNPEKISSYQQKYIQSTKDVIRKKIQSANPNTIFQLTDTQNSVLRGEINCPEFTYSIFEMEKDGTISCFPVNVYKFKKEELIAAEGGSKKEESFKLEKSLRDVMDKRTKARKANKMARQRRERFQAKLEEGASMKAGRVVEEEDTLSKLLSRQQARREISQVEATGELGMEEASDDEGQFDAAPVDTTLPFEGYDEDNDVGDTKEDKRIREEREHYLSLLKGKRGRKAKGEMNRKKIAEKEELLSDISEGSDSDGQSPPSTKKAKYENVASELTDEKVAKAISKNQKMTTLDLIRSLNINTSKKQNKVVLGKILKKIALMKSQGDKKYFVLKPAFAALYCD